MESISSSITTVPTGCKRLRALSLGLELLRLQRFWAPLPSIRSRRPAARSCKRAASSRSVGSSGRTDQLEATYTAPSNRRFRDHYETLPRRVCRQRELSEISHVSGCEVRHGGQFSRQLRKSMPTDRVRADQYLALLGFALSFLFLLAVVALAFTVTNGTRDASPASIAAPAK
jgi:hypothetical protein